MEGLARILLDSCTRDECGALPTAGLPRAASADRISASAPPSMAHRRPVLGNAHGGAVSALRLGQNLTVYASASHQLVNRLRFGGGYDEAPRLDTPRLATWPANSSCVVQHVMAAFGGLVQAGECPEVTQSLGTRHHTSLVPWSVEDVVSRRHRSAVEARIRTLAGSLGGEATSASCRPLEDYEHRDAKSLSARRTRAVSAFAWRLAKPLADLYVGEP